jgi:hypothetical protein
MGPAQTSASRERIRLKRRSGPHFRAEVQAISDYWFLDDRFHETCVVELMI